MSILSDNVSSTTTTQGSVLTERAPVQLQWELVFDGVWLARRDGRFAGMVQGTFDHPAKLTDAGGNVCGLYRSLDDAKAALGALTQ